MVSGVRSPAAARRWGAAWASGGTLARGGAQGPRAARSRRSTARSSRAAVPEAVQRWQLRAGSLGSVTSSLGVPGTSTGSCGVFGSFPPLGREGELGFPRFETRRRGRGRGEPGGRGGRGDRAGLRGSSSRRPRSRLQTASVKRTASILSLSPALTPSFFSCLTNPRIIQLRKCWKEVSEGGGRRVEIFGSSVLVCVWSGGSRWVG